MKRARARTGLRGQLLLLIGACAGAASLAGCYDTNPCRAEVCDGKDNDCDGAIDDGFIDEFGLYSSDEHCGACALSCSNVFPGAQTSCMSSADGAPRCVIDACPPGERLIPDGTCVPELNVQCMACDGDAECETFAPGARCLRSESGGGHCGMPCSGPGDCDRGFNCVEDGGGAPQCQPATSTCACTEALVGARFGCLLHNADGDACAGVQRCEASGLGACVPALEERCNGIDDDCDDRADEDFVDDRGRYLSAEHCGECGKACVAPGPFMQANCLADRAGARCEAECLTDHVDLDQLLVTGCECQLMSGPGVVIGADADCDGVIDETPEFIFVSAGGDDDNAGDDAGAPVRSLARGLARGRETGRTVLVARGIYTGPVALEPGVTLLGGYSPDFRQRDVALFPVSIEADPAQPGAPVLHCADLREPAVVDGLTVLGGDATLSGEGSTAVFLDGCGPELVLKDVVVVAGRGAAGLPGADSTANLAPLGLNSLADLDGVNGGQGTAGDPSGASCSASPAGAGGGKSCPSGATSGGDGGASQCTDLSLVCDNLSGAPCGNSGCTDYTDGNGSCDLAAARAAAIANPAAGDGSGEAPGAAGESAYASPTNRQSCNFCDDNPSLPRAGGDGGDGASGDDGRAGRGCAGLELVDFTLGRVAAGGGRDGASGLDGSGGGGATAGAGFSRIGSTNGSCTDVAGGSGGGGGSGGCGAPGADAGGGGGASLGLLIRLPDGEEAGPQLMNVRVLTSSGGDGGAGGIGAAGGPGGAGGIGGTSQFWCARDGGRGGDGGKGGDGGGGGGGCGGGSYGVYVAGAASDAYAEELRKGSVIERAGVAGQAGPGGFSPGSAGEAGLPGSVRDFVFAR